MSIEDDIIAAFSKSAWKYYLMREHWANLFVADSRRTPSVKLLDASIAKPFFALGWAPQSF